MPPDSPRWPDLVDWLTRGDGRTDVVVDAGTGSLPPALAAGPPGVRRTLVTRACYLALRRAARSVTRPDAVVLIAEPGRALRRQDVEQSIGAPVVVTLSVDPRVARAVDAGLLQSRLPHMVDRELRAAPSRPAALPPRLRLAR